MAVGTLQVNPSRLTDLAGRCNEIAGELAAVTAPTGAGPNGLASTVAVRLSHERVGGVVRESTNRMRGTALRLISAGTEITCQQAESAEGFATLERAPR